MIDQATLQGYWHIQSRTGATTLSELYATVTLYAKGRARIRIEIQGFENPDAIRCTTHPSCPCQIRTGVKSFRNFCD